MTTSLSSEVLELDNRQLRLAPLTPADVDLSVSLLCDPEVMRYVDDVMRPEEMRAQSEQHYRRATGVCIRIWTVTHKETDATFATCLLTPIPIDSDDVD